MHAVEEATSVDMRIASWRRYCIISMRLARALPAGFSIS